MPQAEEKGGMTPGEALGAIWRYKILVGLSTVFALLGTIVWLSIVTPEYTAMMVIGPVPKNGVKGGSAGVLDVGSFLGAGLGGGLNDADFSKFLAILDSVAVAGLLEEQHGVMKVVFDSQWNGQTWAQPDSLGTSVSNAVKSILGLPGWTPPTTVDLAAYIKKSVDVAKKGESALRVLSFSHKDREFAVAFLKALHQETDALLRAEAIRRSSAEIEYLKEKLRTLTVNEQRQTFIDMLSEQEKTMVLLQIGLPFTAAEIDPASASIRPTFPKGGLTLVVGIVGGFLFGCLAALILSLRQRSEDADD